MPVNLILEEMYKFLEKQNLHQTYKSKNKIYVKQILGLALWHNKLSHCLHCRHYKELLV